MNRAGLVSIIGGVVVVGAGAWWWWSHHAIPLIPQAGSPQASHSSVPSASPVPPSPGRSSAAPSAPGSSVAAPQPAAGLGSVGWATQWQAVLAHQWGAPAAPLWIVPDLTQPHAWLALEPVAHHGDLWWGLATPQHPLPTFHAVSTTLNLTNGQIAALPPVMQGALNQAYDLHHSRPWPLRVQTPLLAAHGALSVAQAEANGTIGDPVGWQIFYSPGYPAADGLPATPAQLELTVIQPWTTQGTPELVGESMIVRASGRLLSGADVTVLMNGQTLTPLPPTDVKAWEPLSAQAGLQTPTAG